MPIYSSPYLDRILSTPTINMSNNNFNEILNDLQPNILRHHNKRFSLHIFISFKKTKENYPLNGVAPYIKEIISAKEQLTKKNDKVICCFYLTAIGYLELGISQNIPAASKAFPKGIDKSIVEEFDKDNEKPSLVKFKGRKKLHAMAMIASNDIEEIKKVKKTWDDMEKDGKIITERKYGYLKSDRKDWFNIKDGISQPIFFPEKNFIDSRGSLRKDDIDSLDLVLEEDPGGTEKNSKGENASFGSYVAVLQFQQNVKNFNTVAKEIGKGKLEKGKTKIIGRYPNGKALTLSPSAKDAKKESNENDFGYMALRPFGRNKTMTSDENGLRCPLSAHIRKANPRVKAYDYKKRKIARRGVLYRDDMNSFEDMVKPSKGLKKEFNEMDENKDDRGGLLFISFQRSLEDQFEFILKQMQSIYSSNGRTVSGRDELLRKRNNGQSLVTFKGGAYFFAPSISCLKNICNHKQQNGEVEGIKKGIVNKPGLEPEKPPEIEKIYSNDGTGIKMPKIKFGDIRDELIMEIIEKHGRKGNSPASR